MPHTVGSVRHSSGLCGRQVGTSRNVRDVSSRYAQIAHRLTVERLETFDYEECEWREILLEDRQAGPAETAAARIDVRSPRR